MPRIFRSLALAGALALPVATAAAAPLGLDEAIRQALAHNPELLAHRDQADAAEARADGAWGALLPQVGVRYMARRSDNPLDAFADKLNTRSVTAADLAPAAINEPGTSSLHATQLSVELPIYTGGRLRAGIREAGGHAEAARLAFERHRQATVYQVTQAYRNAQAAARGLDIANDAVEAARDHAETTARLSRQGRIVASDRLTAELNLAAMESMREQVANRQRLALDQLRLVLGLTPDAALELPAWEPPASREPAKTVDAEPGALSQRKDLQAREALLRASRARISAARSAFQPQIGVVAADSWYDDNAALDNKSQSIMGVVSLNLFNGGRDWHGLTAARREADQTERQLEAARLAAHNEMRAAASRQNEARARMQIAGNGVDKARETVRLVRQRYGEGRTILIDLLMAERVLVEARNEELNAALQLELSQVQMQLADGSLALPGTAPSP